MDTPSTNSVDVGHRLEATGRRQEEDNIAFESDESSATVATNQITKHSLKDSSVIFDKCKNIKQNNGKSLDYNVQLYQEENRSKVEGSVITRNDQTRHSKLSFLQDPVYRKKIIKTSFVLFEIIAMGWLYGQMGPTLPDLRLIANASLEQATWLFTGYSIGYLMGCSATGLIGKRLGLEGVVGLSAGVCAFAVALLPWIPNIIGMIIVRVIIGFCTGTEDTEFQTFNGKRNRLFPSLDSQGQPWRKVARELLQHNGGQPIMSEALSLDKRRGVPIVIVQDNNVQTVFSGTHSLVFKMWGSGGGPVLQMGHVVFAIGGTLSPLASKPFLIEGSNYNYENTVNNSLLNTTSGMPKTTGRTITEMYTQDAPTLHSTTNVQYAYIITGCMMLFAAIPFLVIFLKTCRSSNGQSDRTPEAVEGDAITNISSNTKRTLVIIFLGISFIATPLLDMFPNLLTTFLMSKLNWTQQSSSTITATFFAAYGIGNFINVFTLLLISTTKLIIISYVSGIVSLSCFVYGVFTDHTTLIWVAVPAFALSFSSVLPTLFTWTQSHVTPITTKIASAFLVSGSFGVMLSPLLTGYLMDNISLMWFVYISGGQSVLCFLLFISALSVQKLCAKKTKPDEGITTTRL